MSDFSPAAEKARRTGLPRFLAEELQVTVKTVGRWCDLGLVPGFYRTSQGHRRIRYTEDTVYHVERAVRMLKESNHSIRRLNAIRISNRIVDVRRCRTVHDVHRRVLEDGCNRLEARQIAFVPRTRGERYPNQEEVWPELAYALHDLELTDPGRNLGDLEPQLLWLASADSDCDFRYRAEQLREKYLNTARSEFPLSPNARADLGELLGAPGKEAFLERLDAFTGALSRPLLNESVLLRVRGFVSNSIRRAFLLNEALKLRRRGQPVNATNLADSLCLERRKFYRLYGQTDIAWARNHANARDIRIGPR